MRWAPKDFFTRIGAPSPLKKRLEDAERELSDSQLALEQETSQRASVERRLREALALFAHSERLAKLGHWEFDEVETKLLFASEELAHLHGTTKADLFEFMVSLEADADRVHPDDRERYMAAGLSYRDNPTRSQCEYKLVRRDGEVIDVIETWEPSLDLNGKILRSYGVVQDISNQKRAEAELRESEKRFKFAVGLAGLGYYIWDPVAGMCIYCSEEFARIHGVTVDEYIDTMSSGDQYLDLIHIDDRDTYLAATEQYSFDGGPVDLEYRIVTPSGDVRCIRKRMKLNLSADGKSVHTEEGVVQDVTLAKLAEERLHQSQKLEAVGRLTGGVAHDFNNLLATIMGNAELLVELHGIDRKEMQSILHAAQRGSELTQRLLSFSRLQTLQAQQIALQELLESMSNLLERSLGKHMEVDISVESELWAVRTDTGQLENAILNLAINARDAMSGNGRLSIACTNEHWTPEDASEHAFIQPGDYVVVAVGDEGLGMTPEVLGHAFEPFFTTKEVGEGTGLGLSMVYGFAKQSDGYVEIVSDIGRGTIVKLYLPATIKLDIDSALITSAEAVPMGDGQSILVIEDNHGLRTMTLEMLKMLNYRVEGVVDAGAAQAQLEAGEVPHMILSDVVLPSGMSGPAFALRAREEYPDIKFVFMSGYTADSEELQEMLRGNSTFLSKPFRLKGLAKQLELAFN